MELRRIDVNCLLLMNLKVTFGKNFAVVQKYAGH